MQTVKFIRYLILLLFIVPVAEVKSQLSFGGKPVDEYLFPLNEIAFKKMPEFNMRLIPKTFDESSIQLKSLVFAHAFAVQLNPENSGEWRILPDGRRIWKLGINSDNAYSLNIIFDQFLLNEGAKLFIYTPDRKNILGAFNHKNNNELGLAIAPLPGENLILQLVLQPGLTEYGQLNISAVNHDYLGIFGYKANQNAEAGRCNVDINCPEGNSHQLEKNAVLKLIINGNILCTGALVNNTSQDGRPFVLTANHCLATQAEATNTLFIFGYEAISCNGPDAAFKSLSGSQLRATNSSFDMSLLELSSIPPVDFRPYYLGWNRQNIAATQTTGIHHPLGDVKKISRDLNPPAVVTVSGFGTQAHWLVASWEIGTTEGGSSGSPLLDQNNRIVGILTGGAAACGNSINDYYGRLFIAWESFSPVAEQLKAWLDPVNTGQPTLNGFNPHRNQTPLQADFEISTTLVCQGEIFVFTDFSRGMITSHIWNFGSGASPANATGPGPHFVRYSTPGVKTVSLLVGNGTNVNETQRNITISIKSTFLPVADFSFHVNQLRVAFTNISLNAESNYWDFGDRTISQLTNPVKNYTVHGTYPVKLWIRSGPCSDTTVKMVRVIPLTNDTIRPPFIGLRVYPNPAKYNLIIEFSPDQNLESFELVNLKGKIILSGILTQSPYRIDLHEVPSGVYILNLKGKYHANPIKLLVNK